MAEENYLVSGQSSAASYQPSAAGYDCWSFGDLEKTVEKEDWSWVDASPLQEPSRKGRKEKESWKGKEKEQYSLPKLSLFKKYRFIAYMAGALLCGGLGYQIAQQEGYLIKIKNKASKVVDKASSTVEGQSQAKEKYEKRERK